ncbi:zinc transporter ZntB [Shewanella marina]|uniref:zinc transporter ZntB n=1 Tax=Shewanella marina TaxID=487319 RepID=UPI00046F67E4|nr:zinc transporter ZntB [Shewanella marina]
MSQCFIYEYLLNGQQACSSLSEDQLSKWKKTDGLIWIHLNYTNDEAKQWILNSDLADIEKSALLAKDVRPRVNQTKDGLFMALRGINLNPEDKPEDMVSVRCYIEKNRIITTANRTFASLDTIADHIEQGFGPDSIGSFVVSLCDHLTAHKSDIIETLDDKLAQLEDAVEFNTDAKLRNDIAVLRRQTVSLRRYLLPQREAFSKLVTDSSPLLSISDRQKLHEVNDKLIRVLEDLDSIRERAHVTQEELMSLQSESLNQRLYFLALITTIFLPLGFLTGLFGVNLAGIPGSNYPSAFIVFCGLLILLALLQLVLFYRRKWL